MGLRRHPLRVRRAPQRARHRHPLPPGRVQPALLHPLRRGGPRRADHARGDGSRGGARPPAAGAVLRGLPRGLPASARRRPGRHRGRGPPDPQPRPAQRRRDLPPPLHRQPAAGGRPGPLPRERGGGPAARGPGRRARRLPGALRGRHQRQRRPLPAAGGGAAHRLRRHGPHEPHPLAGRGEPAGLRRGRDHRQGAGAPPRGARLHLGPRPRQRRALHPRGLDRHQRQRHEEEPLRQHRGDRRRGDPGDAGGGGRVPPGHAAQLHRGGAPPVALRLRGQPRPDHQGGDQDPPAPGGPRVRLPGLPLPRSRGPLPEGPAPGGGPAGQHPAGEQHRVPLRPGPEAGALGDGPRPRRRSSASSWCA